MFDFLPNAVTLVITNLWPLYATHKALATTAINPNPSPAVALLSPWLTYYAVASLIPAAENNIPLLTWFPFYAWFRMGAYIYLLMPGETVGATYIYRNYIGPFITSHERDIETFIRDAHDKGMQFGLGAAIEVFTRLRAMILGQQAEAEHRHRQHGPSPPASNDYVASLLSKFTAPVGGATGPASGTAGTVYGVLSSALGQAANAARGPQQSLLPPEITASDDKLNYISAQREKLSLMLGEYAAEESRINNAKSGERMRKSGSEVDFDRIEHDDLAYGDPAAQKTWFDTFWGGKEGGRGKKTQ